ncbi:methyltransferase domain protein [Orientia tsutsugamushi str. UT144]|uniref:Methyltransferase domain protein n=1 Tax=Orientia tsutsugamushi str. UT144 TaxID=1441384 RepID=A0A0F3RRX6_ORITS|nr:class I SAM-dependent methyltransferase [Orientia tsutsugamushi]KJW07884.1 methyltransferase domain protein [Orientia tsutsugamushi str. UT144]
MKTLKHTTAEASYYNTRAECYDEFNENNSRAINALLEKILKEHHVATVLDLTCGTGSQVFWLKEKGFEIVGSDISRSMLKIAKQKAKLNQLKIKFLQGDCRTIHAGQFDAAITIFNAIEYLTREDFKLTIQNINRNLNPSGLYIFDIFNLDYLKACNNITKLTVDWMVASEGQKFREIQFSPISDDGILASYSTYVYQDGNKSPTKVSKGYENTLQVYGSDELQEILKENGFVVLAQTDINGEAFSKESSERILTIAKKV